MNESESHSKLGIVSTFLAVGIWIYLAILFWIIFKTNYFSEIIEKYVSTKKGGMVDGFADFGIALSLLALLFLGIPIFGHITGIMFGIFNLFSKTKKRLFGVIGLILNLLPFVLSIALYLIGLFSGNI